MVPKQRNLYPIRGLSNERPTKKACNPNSRMLLRSPYGRVSALDIFHATRKFSCRGLTFHKKIDPFVSSGTGQIQTENHPSQTSQDWCSVAWQRSPACCDSSLEAMVQNEVNCEMSSRTHLQIWTAGSQRLCNGNSALFFQA